MQLVHRGAMGTIAEGSLMSTFRSNGKAILDIASFTITLRPDHV